jgi:hypothetical protein
MRGGLGLRFRRGFRRGLACGQKLGYLGANVLLLLIVEELRVRSRVLRANHSLLINEHDERNERPLRARPLQVVKRGESAGPAHRKRRVELFDERRNVGILINRCFQDLKAFWAEFLLNATQDLSGFLAVRSSGENEYEAQYLASVLTHQRLRSVRQLHDELRRFARNLRRYSTSQGRCQQKQVSKTHGSP